MDRGGDYRTMLGALLQILVIILSALIGPILIMLDLFLKILRDLSRPDY